MNVVGRVGNLITTVAIPFHPFGGAVDVIVVKQPDGSFRSTPWYIRFGKFQGVLKTSEKFVRISVNGVEADFHMYLDNSGEAYFIKEVELGSDANGVYDNSDNIEFSSVNGDFPPSESESDNIGDIHRFEHSISDSGVAKLKCEDRLERAKSEGDRSYYEFQDGHSSLDEAYANLDEENIVESENLDSEVVLVSVDGHILTAPITSSEQSSENVQSTTPKFHPAPCEESESCEGKDVQNVLAVDYVSQLDNASGANDDNGGIGHRLVVCEGEEDDHACQVTGTRDIAVSEENIERQSGKSFCKVEDTVLGNQSLSMDIQCSTDSPCDVQVDDGIEDERPSPTRSSVSLNNCISTEFQTEDSSMSVNETLESKDDSLNAAESTANGEGSSNGLKESPTETYDEVSQSRTNTSFEISLCGNKVYPGMGLEAASEAFNAHLVSAEEFKTSFSTILKNGNLIIRFKGQYFTWEKAACIALGIAAFGLDDFTAKIKDAIPVETKTDVSQLSSTPTGGGWRWSIPFRRVKMVEPANSISSNEDEFVDSESVLPGSVEDESKRNESPRKQFVRTNVPTSKQIASLNLKDGQNIVTFSFSTRIWGKQEVEAHMYLWKWNTRIVISDVDGTITKSDVLGQFMPLFGKDWSQSGVAKLFSAIKENGYQLLFLSARAIVQAYLTRSFLFNLKQDGNTLPNGPVVISPDGLFPSLYREVIRRAPHEFKIGCLEDIKKLFPSDYNPFYAGFGNRDTDELSYRKIGIPKGKIFIINPKGEVAISHRIDVKSYTSLHTLVNDMFPPTSLVEQLQEDYNSWNFWKVPLPDVEL